MIHIDMVCFCHLRWNFIFQRPQHLLSRFARHCRVFFIEEPVFNATNNHMQITRDDTNNVWILVPHIINEPQSADVMAVQKELLDRLLLSMQIKKYILWYYLPMALGYS